ncbi:MAG: hypothetical protein LQ340_007196 [Diploschistes diacapsis]|nr:MAG: hypothetical protein LQ340_007196 [Diploschistes diacapsis]
MAANVIILSMSLLSIAIVQGEDDDPKTTGLMIEVAPTTPLMTRSTMALKSTTIMTPAATSVVVRDIIIAIPIVAGGLGRPVIVTWTASDSGAGADRDIEYISERQGTDGSTHL